MGVAAWVLASALTTSASIASEQPSADLRDAPPPTAATGPAASSTVTDAVPPPTATDPVVSPETAEPGSAISPIDDERPMPTGLGLERRAYRTMQERTSLDLGDAWDDFEEEYDRDESPSFAQFVRQRFKRRRDGGIGITMGGIGFTAGTSIFWVYVVGGVELPEGKALFAVLGVAVTGLGITVVGVGASMWSRNQKRLNALRGLDLAVGSRLRVRGVTPLVLQGGGGLGLAAAF